MSRLPRLLLRATALLSLPPLAVATVLWLRAAGQCLDQFVFSTGDRMWWVSSVPGRSGRYLLVRTVGPWPRHEPPRWVTDVVDQGADVAGRGAALGGRRVAARVAAGGTGADAHPGVALLRTAPGVGPRTAEAFVAYVDDVRRFARTKQVGCYLGLVPCQDSSAGRDRLGHITGDGPATVRMLLCEAAWQAARRSPSMKRFFERVTHNDPGRRKIALTAAAHKLARAMAAMLRSGEAWREDVAGPA